MTEPDAGPAAPSPLPGRPLLGGTHVGFGLRLVAYIVDVIIVVIAIVIFAQLPVEEIAGILILALAFGYIVYFTGTASGQTPGKKLLGIRVVDAYTGEPIGFGRSAFRWVGMIISGLFCYLGYLWVIWDPAKQGWHDKIASTLVVLESEHPVEKWPG